MRFYKYFEYAYIAVALFFGYEAFRMWNEARDRAYLFLFLSGVAIAMYFFKRWFRKRVEKRNQS